MLVVHGIHLHPAHEHVVDLGEHLQRAPVGDDDVGPLSGLKAAHDVPEPQDLGVAQGQGPHRRILRQPEGHRPGRHVRDVPGQAVTPAPLVRGEAQGHARLHQTRGVPVGGGDGVVPVRGGLVGRPDVQDHGHAGVRQLVRYPERLGAAHDHRPQGRELLSEQQDVPDLPVRVGPEEHRHLAAHRRKHGLQEDPVAAPVIGLEAAGGIVGDAGPDGHPLPGVLVVDGDDAHGSLDDAGGLGHAGGHHTVHARHLQVRVVGLDRRHRPHVGVVAPHLHEVVGLAHLAELDQPQVAHGVDEPGVDVLPAHVHLPGAGGDGHRAPRPHRLDGAPGEAGPA